MKASSPGLIPLRSVSPKGQVALIKKFSRRAARMVPRVALRSSAALLAVFALFGFNPQALAETDTWVGSPTSTDLNTGANWSFGSGGTGVVNGDSLVFTSANASTSNTLTDTLPNNTQISITFNSGAPSYTLTGNSFEDNAGFADNSTNVETIDNTVTWFASHSVSVAFGGDLVFAGIVGGNKAFLTNSSSGGVITFQGANTLSAATTITQNGTIDYENGTAFGVNSVISETASGGTVQVQGGITGGTQKLTIVGPGAADGTGALENVSGTNSYGGQVALTGATTISSDTGTLNLTYTGSLSGSGDALTLSGTAGNGNISSVIAIGTAALTMNGGGTWSLNGANSFTGAVTINSGTLALGGAGDLGYVSAGIGSYAGNISNAGTLSYGSSATQTLSGIVSGTGTLTQAGTGPLTLTGVNTYTGPTTITSGTLALTGAGELNSGSYAGNISNAGTFSYGGTSPQTLSGIISGAGTLAVASTGGLTLTGVNTYTGPTTITSGTLAIGGAGQLNSGSYAGNISNAGTLSYGSSANQTLSGVISGAGTLAVATTGALTLTGVNTYTGPTTITSGTLALGAAGQLNSGSYSGSISNAGTFSYTSSANQSLSGNISGTGALIAAGTGTLSLTGSNSYSGGTTISSGELLASNTTGSATGTGALTVGGGTLGLGATTTQVNTSAFVFNSGGLSFMLNGTGDAAGLITTPSATFTATPTISLSVANITSGEVFTLLTSTNPITGGSFLSSIAPTTIGRLTITTTESGNSLIATASGSAANLVWAGGVSGLGTGTASQGDGATWNNTQNSSASNWNNGGHYDYFYDLDNVTFNDTGSPSRTVNLTTANSPASVTVNTAGSYTFTGPGSITGAGNVAVTSGTLNLDTANSYSGGTSISAGADLVTGTAGALPGSGFLTVAGTLDMSGDNQTIATLTDGNVTTGMIKSTSVSPATLTVSSGGSISANLTLSNADLSVGGGVLIVSGTVAGDSSTASLTTTGAGTVNETASGTLLNSLPSFTQGSTGSSTLGGVNIYTGAINVTAGALNLTGTLNGSNISNGATFTESSTGAITGASTLTTSAGTTTLNGVNTYTGATTISGGALAIAGAGQLGSAGTYAGNISDAGTFTYGSSASETLSGVISGAGGVTEAGPGTLTVTNAETYTGPTTISGGTLNYQGTLGVSPAAGGGQFNVGVAGGGNAQLNIPSTANLTLASGNSMLIGNGATTALGQGFVYQSAGSSVTGVNNVRLGAGASGASYGYYNLAGGTLSTTEMDIGGPNDTAAAVLDMSGGTVNVTNLYLAEGTGGVGILNLTGGTINVAGNIGTNGGATGNTLVLNIANGNVLAGSANLSLASSTTTILGEINLLPGGLLEVASLNPAANSSQSTLNFDGGTLKASGPSTVFIAGSSNSQNIVDVYSGGGTIDNNGFAISLTKVLSNPGTSGLNGTVSIASGGTGYQGAPTVTFSGGGGVGAAGYAVVSGGVVTSVVITNPGAGYTSAPTITLTGGGYSSIASATAPTPSTDTGGGMTFQGSGTTTDTRVDNYTGPTAVNGGTLIVSGGLSATSALSVTNGTLDINVTQGIYENANVTLSSGTLVSLASETQLLGTLTLAGGNSQLTFGATASNFEFEDSSTLTWNGTLTINDWNGASAGSGSDLLFIGGPPGSNLTPAQLADITFVNGTEDGNSFTTLGAVQLSDGEIVAAAIPEPGDWGTVIFGLGILTVWRRSRRRNA